MRLTFALTVALLAACTPPSAAPRTVAGPPSPAPASRDAAGSSAGDPPRLYSAAATASLASAQPSGPGGIRRTLIGREPALGLPGWETRLYLIEYAPGAAAPLHAHPAVGVGLVLEGRFESAFADEPVVEVQAGQAFVDQAEVTHRVFRNPSADRVLRFVVAYTLRAGDEPLHLGPGRAGR